MFLLDLGLDFSTPVGITISIVGILALITFVVSFQVKNRARLLVLQIVSITLFGIQYFLTGAYTGVIIEGVCIVRNLVFFFKGKNKFLNSIWIPIIFGVAATIVGIFTFDNWTSILPVVANIVQGFALFAKKEEHNRFLFLCGSPLWLTYNVFAGLLFGIITECLNIISIVVSIVRIYYKKNKEQEKLIVTEAK